ncbi:putative succinyl-diaminopimelate desuccinylase [Baekduia alba]|uniref:M20/M25/M40 family metallo-hydrolase n=1 Tax=Baekduia alba TaxID=2997333 RepID=UPI002340988F|nr:M20/M25/M40 family metallo-hydrolase [Baekduia alba]WCB95157.1 putative succinyl-diaminopimelate desuccinylase [Baekduia alba]
MSAASDVVELCAQLIAIDSTNFGPAGAKGEREVADYFVPLLRAAGYDPTVLESAPTRANVVVRVTGTSRELPALLVHGHLDVVPAAAEDWSVPPFAGRVADGFVWGRGATDMKDMIASMLATLLAWAREGVRPRRDLVFAFVADEEDDGQRGAEWLVDEHPELFAGVAAAIGEAGGAPVDVAAPDGTTHRFYPVAVAERGSLHMSVRATGTAGHGSQRNDDNAVVHLVAGLQRLAAHRWPLRPTPATQAFLEQATRTLGLDVDVRTEAGIEAALDRFGALRPFVEPALRCSTTLTVLEAGNKMNVIPSAARAEIDVRSLPGTDDAMLAIVDELLGPAVSRTMLSDSRAIAAPLESPWYDAIARCVVAADPEATVLPFCMAGGTDAKPFSRLGIPCYGFAPRGPDPEGRVPSGAHGVDERIPVAALEGGARMLRALLETI